jgi:hypothetical protein
MLFTCYSLAQMFQVPEREYWASHCIFITSCHLHKVIMMAVGASRIYRYLADYTCMSEFNWNEEK